MIFVDSNVFVIDLRYRRDIKHGANAAFLGRVRRSGAGATTLANLLEVAGILSFDLDRRRLGAFVTHFPEHYGIRVLPPASLTAVLPPVTVGGILALMEKRMALGDAMVAYEVELYARTGDIFVTWDEVHFAAKLSIPAVSPADAC